VETKKEETLKVAEARSKDVGRGIARVDGTVAEKLGLTAGDTIIIEGRKKTACIVWPGYPEDYSTGVSRIDGTVRRNAGIGIDDKVKIKKVVARNAERITLAPAEELRIVGGEEYLSQILEGRVVTRGDIIELNVMGRKVDMVVINIKPVSEAAIVQRETLITVSEKTAKAGEEKGF